MPKLVHHLEPTYFIESHSNYRHLPATPKGPRIYDVHKQSNKRLYIKLRWKLTENNRSSSPAECIGRLKSVTTLQFNRTVRINRMIVDTHLRGVITSDLILLALEIANLLQQRTNCSNCLQFFQGKNIFPM